MIGKYGVYDELRTLILNDIGCFLRRKNEIMLSMQYFDLSLQISERNKIEFSQSLTLMNLSALYQQIDEYNYEINSYF
jgi:hypothetical protein